MNATEMMLTAVADCLEQGDTVMVMKAVELLCDSMSSQEIDDVYKKLEEEFSMGAEEDEISGQPI